MVNINSSGPLPALLPDIEVEPAYADGIPVEDGVAAEPMATEPDTCFVTELRPALPPPPPDKKIAPISIARVDLPAFPEPRADLSAFPELHADAAVAGIEIGGLRFANLDAPIAIGSALAMIIPLRLHATHRLPWLAAAAVSALTFAYSSSAAGPILPLFATVACTFAMAYSILLFWDNNNGEQDSKRLHAALDKASLRGAAYWFREVERAHDHMIERKGETFDYLLLHSADEIPNEENEETYNYASLLGPRSVAKFARRLVDSPRAIHALESLAEVNARAASAEAVAGLKIRWKPEALDDPYLEDAVKWLMERGNKSVVRYLRAHAQQGHEIASELLDTYGRPKPSLLSYRNEDLSPL